MRFGKYEKMKGKTVSNPVPAPGVKSALRTLDLIEYVVACQAGVVAQEIAAALSIPVSSLSYLLATLVERGYLRREGRRYFAGDGVNRLRGPEAAMSLVDRARPLIKGLQVQFNETATLFEMVEGWQVEAVFSETAGQPLRYAIEVGTRAPLHSVSAGKVLLAAMSDEKLAEYLAGSKRERFTEHTICGCKEIMAEIQNIREKGIATARGEFTPGLSAVGIAIAPQAAISVAGPAFRVTQKEEERIAAQLRRVAQTFAATSAAA